MSFPDLKKKFEGVLLLYLVQVNPKYNQVSNL